MFGAPFHDPTSYPIPSSSSSPSHSSLMSYQSASSFGSSYNSGSRDSSASSQYGSAREFVGEFDTSGNKRVAWVAPNNYSRNDALVSEIFMKLWTNFAKTGYVSAILNLL